MADFSIASDEQIEPEIQLTAGQQVTVEVQSQFLPITSRVQVMVHSGDKPVYARPGDTVDVQDKKASIIPPGTWFDLIIGSGDTRTIALISAAAAVVSVSRL
jgi:hypothetical protein